MKAKHLVKATGIIFLVGALSACSLKQAAINTVIDSLSGEGSTVFTGDDDPELVGEALPFALKLYETLLAQSPEHTGLLLTTGSGFVMYANAYIQAPSERLPDEEYELRREMRARAKSMYLRGRNYVLDALDVLHPGFREAALLGDPEPFLQEMGEDDIPYLYWASAGWIGAVSIDSFDVKLGMTRENAISLMDRALEIDETWGDGTIHEFYISYYGGLPEMLGGSEEKARYHFQRAVELSQGGKPGPYVALATAVTIKNQNVEEFRSLLTTALEIPAEDPETRLLTIINKDKAKWLLEHIDDYFLVF
jgi:predicted anti-sigma-YlaC factor YlaD